MPEYLAPGVFVEETSFRQKSIEGVGTSTAAFVGATRFGPVDGLPELLTNFGDFERIFAGSDPLMIDEDEVPNLLAYGVRSFFENGGRRCYVARVQHSSEEAVAGTARVPDAGDHLALQARHPGRAGNFQVTITLQMSPNVFDSSTSVPRLRGADEYQVVWIDDLGGTPGEIAYLHDAFDDTNNVWTYDLRVHRGGSDVSLGLASQIDPGVTSAIHVLTADVEVGRLGRFMDAQRWNGLSLHGAHNNSILRVFEADNPDRRTELFVPLIASLSGLDDGPALARVLLNESGATAGLSGTGRILRLGGAVAGTVQLRFDDGSGPVQVDVTVGDTPLAVTDALTAEGLTGAIVSSPDSGTYVIAVDGVHEVTTGDNSLRLPGGVQMRQGTRFVVDTSEPGRFALGTSGQTTESFVSNASNTKIDDALDKIVGPDNAQVERSTTDPDHVIITLWGSHDKQLEVYDNADLLEDQTAAIVEIVMQAAGGTFEIGRPGDLTSVTAPPDLTDAGEMGTAATAIQAALGGGADDPTVAVEGSVFIVTMTADAIASGGIQIGDTSALTAAEGSATATLEEVTESLLDVGVTADVAVRLEDGSDGAFPDPDGYAGDADAVRKSGFGALTDLPDVSIVAAPGSTWNYLDRDAEARGIISHLIRHCEAMRYRIAVVDSGPGQLPSEVLALRGEFDSSHAALYYPWITTYDAITRRPQNFPPSGYVAGIYARNDTIRGVHKAPANETIASAIGFESTVNTAQQELLNPAGVNCLRKLDQRGRRVWGARTMSSDPEWKYVNLRRYFAFLEASIDRGTQWAVFEPNGPLLWDNVRRTVEDFLLNELANNHLLGTSPEEAFFVRCDRSTMTQNDLDNGRLVCLIGVSPLRPAEFVIFRIGQKTLDFVL